MKIRNLQRGILGCLLGTIFSSSALAFTLEGVPGTPLTPTATPLGHFGLTLGLSGLGHSDESMILNGRFLRDSLGKIDTADIRDLESGSMRLNVAMGIGDHFDLGISVPFHVDFLGETYAQDLDAFGPGDPSLIGRLGFPLVGDYVWSLALQGSASLPSKTPKGFIPKHTGFMEGHDTAEHFIAPPYFFSSYGFGGEGVLITTVDLTRMEELPVPIRANLSAGVKAPGVGGNHMVLSGSLEWVPLPFLEFYGDLQTETRLGESRIGKDWMVASAGFTARSDDGVFFSLSGQKSLSSDRYETFRATGNTGVFTYRARSLPNFSIGINLGWTGFIVSPDADGDGVPDKQDPCPRQKEDMDGYEDFDGCPELDNDLDSIPDSRDKCPNEAEDHDGFEDDDGCPETDNDKDGIPDGHDRCPNEPEDMDGFEDFDGCPDLDNDKDGVLDPNDKCPIQAEDVDGFEDTDGCPEPDNDKDNILDINDKCPNEPETLNGFEDTDGCPDVSRHQTMPLEKHFMLRGVQFEGTTTELLAGAYPVLDSLAERLKGDPTSLWEIRGYMDKTGSELEQFRVSEAWAMKVRAYLMNRGVQGTAVLARGMGSRDPIANNKTAAGRSQNRRIEIYRMN
jgi:outer membrane protein OmpA-like peptidoglycan-associated protein